MQSWVGLAPYAPWAGPGLAQSAPERWSAVFVPAELNVETVDDLTEVLTRQNERYLRRFPQTPALYQSGAFYRLQPEYWLAIPWALEAIREGRGLDCKSLAAWRTAELRVRGGEPTARCFGSEHPGEGKTVYHVRVLRQGGYLEDPSALLGMHSSALGAPEGYGQWSHLSRSRY